MQKLGNKRKWIPLIIYALANGLMFCCTAWGYFRQDKDLYVLLARGSAAVIYLNSALVLLTMSRVLVTRLKLGALSRYLALDKHISFHKVVGHVIFAMALVHTGAYLVKYLLSYPSLITPFHEFVNYSGLILVILITFIWLFAQPAYRHHNRFEYFYFSHFLIIPFILLLFFHAPKFAYYALVPCLIYGLDRLFRFKRMRKPLEILSAKTWPGSILELRLKRPPDFYYHPGDYGYLCIPKISQLQWHPFTLSSAPTEPNYISVHMKKFGKWTSQVHQLMETTSTSQQSPQAPYKAIPVYLDGPIGAPASSMMQADNVILIAAGIGITPFIAFLKTLMNTRSHHTTYRKVYLYWVSKSCDAFTWCLDFFAKLLTQHHPHFISIKLRSDEPAVFSADNQLAEPLFVNHPIQWITELKNIKSLHPLDKFTVFYCGPQGLSKILKPIVHKLGFIYKKENF